MRVVLEFLNQFSNAGATRNVEVDVLLVDFTIELVVRVE